MGRIILTLGLLLGAAATAPPAAAYHSDPWNPGGKPELAVSISDSPDPVEGYETLTYSLRVTNAELWSLCYKSYQTYRCTPYGPSATGVQVKLTLPGNVRFLSATGDSGFGCSSNTFNEVWCTGGSIAAGAAAAITVRVAAPCPPFSTTPASISSRAVVDPNNTILERDETNNSATATTSVGAVRCHI